MSRELRVWPVPGMPEVRPGDDLGALICAHAAVRDGDILAVTSKVVSKAEGRMVRGDRRRVAATQPGRVVARRGDTVITRTPPGLVLAAAGVDASNVEPGCVVVLPADPDASARSLRQSVTRRTAANVAVVITDTAGRPWRLGQTDIAVGCAGIAPIDDQAGRPDHFGRPLAVTAPALADEVAAAADLVKGNASRTPVALLRGTGIPVLPAGRHGPGAAALVRPPAEDLFGLGAREAVVAAVERSDPAALAAFAPDRMPLCELVRQAGARLDPRVARLVEWPAASGHTVEGLVREPLAEHLDELVALAVAAERLCALAAASGHAVTEEPHRVDGPGWPDPAPGWRVVLRARIGRTGP